MRNITLNDFKIILYQNKYINSKSCLHTRALTNNKHIVSLLELWQTEVEAGNSDGKINITTLQR